MLYALIAALALSARAVQVEGPAAPVPTVAALGTPQNPLRVAVVGAGPAGFYTADALLKQKDLAVQVDVFEALPTPYGLVRSGLAPDHQRLKNAAKVYDRIAENPAFRYFGNVTVGRDVTEADLSRLFDQVVYASGAPEPRALAVPGAALEGVHPAFDFVGWYNSHPAHQGHRFDLSRENAVVVGAGNTAVDVVRLLAQDPAKLAETDISPAALVALRDSRIKTVTLLARRGPGQAAFSAAELKALAELESADVVVRPRDIEQARGEAGLSANAQKTFDMLAELAGRGAGERARKIRLLFFSSPAELTGRDGRLSEIRVERTRLVPDGKGGLAAQGTGEFEAIAADVLFHAIGWRGRELPGLPFDARSSRIPSRDGRVIDPATGSPLPGRYLAGWARNGGAGLIGDQMRDAAATVASMIVDVPSLTPAAERGRDGVAELLRSRGVEFLTYADWKRLDALETAAGAAAGSVRRKLSSVAEMLSALAASAVPIWREDATAKWEAADRIAVFKDHDKRVGEEFERSLGVRWRRLPPAYEWPRSYLDARQSPLLGATVAGLISSYVEGPGDLTTRRAETFAGRIVSIRQDGAGPNAYDLFLIERPDGSTFEVGSWVPTLYLLDAPR